MNTTDVLEIAVLTIHPGQGAQFEGAFREAAALIKASPGYLGHELRCCIETPDRYVLLVRWRALEDHTVGFRQSPAYQDWKQRLHRFYPQFPTVEHYLSVTG